MCTNTKEYTNTNTDSNSYFVVKNVSILMFASEPDSLRSYCSSPREEQIYQNRHSFKQSKTLETLEKHWNNIGKTKRKDCLFGGVTTENIRHKRDKAPTKFLIIAVGSLNPLPWLPTGFFCLRKLHKFNNSIVRNYFPPHYQSFVKRLNFHLPRLLFSKTVWLSLA